MTRKRRAMPVGVLRNQGAQLRQIIARERTALKADRFHCPQLLCHPGPRVRQKMSKLQGQASGLPVKGASGSWSKDPRAGTGSAATPLTGRPEVHPTKTASLADLYDPLSMPPALVKAHAELDRAVDLCYLPQPFNSERQRVE